MKTKRHILKKACGKGGVVEKNTGNSPVIQPSPLVTPKDKGENWNPILDTQTKDLGNLGKFTPTASTLPTVRQQVKKPVMPKSPLQAIEYPVKQQLQNIIRDKSSYKEYNMSGVNPSFKERKGGFAKQPTGNNYLN